MTDAVDSPPDPRLKRLLGGAELAAVRRRLRRHFERAETAAIATTLRLVRLDPPAHAALCQLTGRPSRSSDSMTLDLADLDAQLRASGLAESLRDALEKLDGPIVARTGLRRALQARWSALAASAVDEPRLAAWLATPAALTLLKRIGREPERAARQLAEAAVVLRRLPAVGATRSRLAADALGDAHALDAGRPVATLVLAAWRHHERAANDDERSRDTWARAGVLVNELARPVLFLNLPPAHDVASQWAAGEPAWLSLRQLLRRPPAWSVAGRRIFVCENPAIVAIAADVLGAACAPLVCTEGMPAAAQRALLDQLAAAGASLCYHGDFDWAGVGIGNFVIGTWRAAPWRYGVADYRQAVGSAPARTRDLEPTRIEARWDPRLVQAMGEHGLAIAEEAIVDTLLEDLRRVEG